MNARYIVAQRLKFLRKHRNMSQDAVSIASGVDRSHLSEIETAKCKVSIDVIEKIAKALNVQLFEMFVDGVAEPQKSYSGEPFESSE